MSVAGTGHSVKLLGMPRAQFSHRTSIPLHSLSPSQEQRPSTLDLGVPRLVLGHTAPKEEAIKALELYLLSVYTIRVKIMGFSSPVSANQPPENRHHHFAVITQCSRENILTTVKCSCLYSRPPRPPPHTPPSPSQKTRWNPGLRAEASPQNHLQECDKKVHHSCPLKQGKTVCILSGALQKVLFPKPKLRKCALNVPTTSSILVRAFIWVKGFPYI